MNGFARITIGALLWSAIAAQAADIDCTRPEPPRMPDGASATEDELAEAGTAVRAFIGASRDYLACLEEKEAGYGDGITAAEQGLIDMIYNAGVEAMEASAAAYNEAVRVFRSREDG